MTKHFCRSAWLSNRRLADSLIVHCVKEFLNSLVSGWGDLPLGEKKQKVHWSLVFKKKIFEMNIKTRV